MTVNTNYNIQQQSPFLEDHIASALDSAQEWANKSYDAYSGPRVAGFSGDQLNAFNLARSGVGAYAPYLTGATNAATTAMNDWRNMAGQSAYWTGQGMQGTNVNPYLLAGSQQINQSTADYANNLQPAQQLVSGSTGGTNIQPQMSGMMDYTRAGSQLGLISPYQNQYRQSVMQDNLREMNRQHEIDQDRIDADAAKSGAFGGSRHGLVEAEAARNYQQNRSDMINKMNMEGFANAQQQREAHRQRQLQAGQGMGSAGQLALTQQEQGYGRMANAGQALGNMAGQYGTFGLNAATGMQGLGQMSADAQNQTYNRMLQGAGHLGNLGQAGGTLGLDQSRILSGLGGLQQQYNQNDITLLSQIGAMGQGQRQAELDAQYNAWLEHQMQPYQRIGWYSDIIRGVPTSQSTITASSTPRRSMLAQGLGALGQFGSTGQQFGWWGNNQQGGQQ